MSSKTVEKNGLVMLVDNPKDPVLANPDLDPSGEKDRTWSWLNLAALWVGMSVCVPTYILAASLVEQGMNWWEAMLAILLGNSIVLVPMILNAHAGTRYGIPFPVFARSAFGVFGAHVPSIARALVACGWFGIQTYIGGEALSEMIGAVWPAWLHLGAGAQAVAACPTELLEGWTCVADGSGFSLIEPIPHFIGLSPASWIAFGVFWGINVFFIVKGTESIKWLENIAAPFLLIIGVALLWWAIDAAGGLGVILDKSSTLVKAEQQHTGMSFVLLVFLPGVTAMLGYWATLSLNIPDFSRYCRSQKDQVLGQIAGLPTTMVLFSFIGVVVTAATVILYGEPIWDPAKLVVRLSRDSGSPWLAFLAMLALAIATLSTNIAANIVSPANSFSNALPRHISFRVGGLLAAAVGVLMCPWLLLGEFIGWLVSYSGLLGAVGGVMIADYWMLRRTKLDLAQLYDSKGIYRYVGGFNIPAIVAMAIGIGVVLLGKVHESLGFLFQGAWFSGFLTSAAVYFIWMKVAPPKGDEHPEQLDGTQEATP